MPDILALIPVDLQTCPLGLPSHAAQVLHRTLRRVAQVKAINAIVLIHPPDQDPLAWLGTSGGESPCTPVHGNSSGGKPGLSPLSQQGAKARMISSGGAASGGDKPLLTTTAPRRDAYSPAIASARKWALSAWRGGLGGATCYDELLPASSLAAAMHQHGGRSALIVGGDWPLVDPALCDRLLDLHLTDPAAMQMTFCQAPPGLAGIVAGRDLLDQFAANNTGFGRLLAYNPQRPQADPIGRDVCLQIDPAVRSCAKRFIYDTSSSRALIDAIDENSTALEIAAKAHALPCMGSSISSSLPQQLTLELTAHRPASGPLVPQHHINLARGEMDLDTALRLVRDLARRDDALLTLGGLGDALRYPHWRAVVDAAHAAGVLGICLETDLLEPTSVLDELLTAPIDILSVRVNADTAATYTKVMTNAGVAPNAAAEHGVGVSAPTPCEAADSPRISPFETILNNLQHLLRSRHHAHPWIIPRLIKTSATLKDMETFFERWMTYCGHAMIEPAVTGLGLMPDFAPVDMSPPRRVACRQLPRRLTIHADGQVPRCDQDWLARAPSPGTPGNAAKAHALFSLSSVEGPCMGSSSSSLSQPLSLEQLWHNTAPIRAAHEQGRWNELELCSGCREWHRP